MYSTTASQFLVMLFLSLLFLSSCQKGKDIINPPSETVLLVDGPWQLAAQTVDPPVEYNGVPVSNEFAQLLDCVTDNNLNFTSTNSFTEDEGDTKCQENDAQIKRSGTWAFNTDATSITISPTGEGSIEREVVNLDRTELILTESFSANGLNYTRTFTYNH